MSGGYFDHEDAYITYVADKLEKIINHPEEGEEPLEEVGDRFKDTLKLLRQCAWRTRSIDLLLSGDRGLDRFIKLWDEEEREERYSEGKTYHD